MKRRLSLLLVALLSVLNLAGCNNSNTQNNNAEVKETKEINFVVPDGLPAISVAKLIEEKPEIEKNYNVNYYIEGSSEALVTTVMKQEPDVAIVPSNVAATVYNKTKAYKIAGTVGWGSFYIGTTLENQTIEDLKGKEVYNIGKGLTPDIVTRIILKEKGFDVDKDINFSYVNGVTELAPIILAGKADYAVIPEPALSSVQINNDKFTTILDLNEEWKKINDSEYGYPQSTIIIKNDLIENDSEFIKNLLSKVKESTEIVYVDEETVGDYCEKVGISTKKPIVMEAIHRSNIEYVGIKDCYKDYEIYFENLNKVDSSTIGGSMPDEAIFMEK